MRPVCWMAKSDNRAGSSGSRRSSGRALAAPPAARISATASDKEPEWRALSTTRAPERPRRSAMARPIPRLAPVTMAVLPLNSICIFAQDLPAGAHFPVQRVRYLGRRRLPILYLHHDLVKTRRLLSEDHRRHIGERMAPDLPLMLAWVARCAAGRYRAQSGGASRADLIIEYRPLPAARLPARLEPGTPGLRAWSKYAN